MLELLNHIKNVLVLSGVEGDRLDAAMFLIEDKLESTMAVSNTVEVKEVEKVVEVIKEVPVEVIKEVIPADVKETLDDNETYINELETELKASLADVQALTDRCNELHAQNEELLKALDEQPVQEVVEELTFEQPEEISNDYILANNSVDEDEELEDLKLEDLEDKSLDDITLDELEDNTFEEPVQPKQPVQSRRKRSTGFTKNITLEEQVTLDQPKPVQRRNTTRNQYNGQSRRRRSTGFTNTQDNTSFGEFKKYLNMIESNELNADNISDKEMQRIIDICYEVNNNQLPTVVSDLYNDYLIKKGEY